MSKKLTATEKKKRLAARKSTRTREAYLVVCELVAAGKDTGTACAEAGISWAQVNAISLHYKDLQEKFHKANAMRKELRREQAETRLHKLAMEGKVTKYCDATGNVKRTVVQDDVESVRATVEALSPEFRKDRGPLVVHNTLQLNTLHKQTLADILAESAERRSLLPEKLSAQTIEAEALTEATSQNTSYDHKEDGG